MALAGVHVGSWIHIRVVGLTAVTQTFAIWTVESSPSVQTSEIVCDCTGQPLSATVHAGDLITIQGSTTTYQGAFELENITSVTVVEAASSQCQDTSLVQSVTLAQIQPGGTDEAKYRFMLVKVLNATSAGADPKSTALFLLQGSPLKVTNFIAGTTAFTGSTFANGAVLTSITGVLDYFSGNQLAPRKRLDITP